jgi:hypothetical protein
LLGAGDPIDPAMDQGKASFTTEEMDTLRTRLSRRGEAEAELPLILLDALLPRQRLQVKSASPLVHWWRPVSSTRAAGTHASCVAPPPKRRGWVVGGGTMQLAIPADDRMHRAMIAASLDSSRTFAMLGIEPGTGLPLR